MTESFYELQMHKDYIKGPDISNVQAQIKTKGQCL